MVIQLKTDKTQTRMLEVWLCVRKRKI